MPTAVSLFTGCGGSDAGISKLGFKILMANDKLAYAKDVYQANHEETDYILDGVENLKSFPSAELLIGCYPCQGFSQGGTRDANKKINTLYLEFARALKIIKPKAFIVENVSGMIRSDFKHLLDDQVKKFTEAGYNVKYKILNASEYGVAQERKRIFIVGIGNQFHIEYAFPKPTHGVSDLLKPFRTIRDAISDLPEWPPENEYYNSDFHWYYLSRNRRRSWDEISKTIVANARHMPLHPVSPPLEKVKADVWQFSENRKARRFSYKEAARLQGFDNLIFPETEKFSLNMCCTVVGNAVPPPLFEAVASALPDIWD